MSKHKIDLHHIYNDGKAIDQLLKDTFQHVVLYKIDQLEIIHGKGSGQLKKRILRFLQQPDIKKIYSRIDKDAKNFGRTFVYFKHK